MNLNFKTNRCPICLCDKVISEEIKTETYSDIPKIKTDIYGNVYYSRTFLCGCTIEKVGNREEIASYPQCVYDPKKIKEKIKEKEDKEKLKKFIAENDLNDEILRRLKSWVL